LRKERLPKGSLEVIEILEEKGSMTQKEIISNLKHKNPRAVRYTVRQLAEMAILDLRANFEDMRSSLININKEMDEFFLELLNSKKKSTL
jgi:hypothetical protein